MLSNVIKVIFATAMTAVMAMALAGCGHQGTFEDPWYSNPPAISHEDGNAMVEPDETMDSGMVKAPDYESLPGDVLRPNDDISYR